MPLAMFALGFFPNLLVEWNVMWSLIVACGGTALLADLARSSGKRIEQTLFEKWGGQPTVALLRHQGVSNKVLLHRRHRRLHSLTGHRILTMEEEQQDSLAADAVYEACSTYLRSITRDGNAAKLVFEENCNYGFRRNMLGLKPFGITTSIVGTVGTAALFVVSRFTEVLAPSPLAIISGIVNFLLFVFWLQVVDATWVKSMADAYANRLLEACDNA